MADSAADFVPRSRSLPTLRKAARDCRGCDLEAVAILRVRESAEREDAFAGLVEDLEALVAALRPPSR